MKFYFFNFIYSFEINSFGVNGMGGNTLNLILTSDPERILENNYFPPLKIIKVGHAVISITLGLLLENESELNPNKRDVLKANFKSISEEMGKVDWENNLNGLEVNEAYSRFLSVYEKIWNEYVPLKRNFNGRKGKGSMSKEIKGMVRQIHKL